MGRVEFVSANENGYESHFSEQTAILVCRTSAPVGALRQDRMPPIPGAGQEERLVLAQVATEALVRSFFL